MSSVIPYLVFPGTCKEAMKFYCDVLQGEITSMQTFGSSEMEAPPGFEERIFNSELRASGIQIKASDDLPGFDVNPGNNISLFVVFDDASTKREAFKDLAEGGKVLFPLDDNFGMLSDRYGVQWMFTHESS